MSLSAAAEAIRNRAISAVELTRACLQRIDAWQPVTNAFIAIEADRAMATAERADAALAAGQPLGPLHGVPLAHKDMYYRAGRVTSCGSKVRATFVPTVTATVLQRLDDAGAIDLGRLNMSEFALGPTGINAHFGRARNPWDRNVVTGGSSSGSGAAVAAGMVFGALGSDTGGSIRLPSALCGIAGLKPTQGRVSRFGAMPLSFSQDCVGPMAPDVADVALLYAAIAGQDSHDPTCVSHPVIGPQTRTTLDGMTLGFCDAWASDLDGDTERALADARARMIDLGATIKSVGLPDPLELGELSNIVTMTEAAAIHSDWLRERPDEYGPQIRSRLRQGMIIPGTIYLRAIEMRAALLGDVMRTAFAGCDALMLPAVPFAPPRAADMDGTSTGGAIGTAIPQMVAAMARFTRPISYLGLPGLSLPIGRSGSDLPIGMQLVGRPFDEAGILSIGIAFERAGGVRRRLPSSL
jgi:aspartyl-tRNA(Asn)/glutamyl-tRNA(Gln) amidotransferase subunit A